MTTKPTYVRITAEQIPAGVRFDVPARFNGQIVEVAWGGFGRYQHGPGDEYQRVVDRSDGSTRYYRRQDVELKPGATE